MNQKQKEHARESIRRFNFFDFSNAFSCFSVLSSFNGID